MFIPYFDYDVYEDYEDETCQAYMGYILWWRWSLQKTRRWRYTKKNRDWLWRAATVQVISECPTSFRGTRRCSLSFSKHPSPQLPCFRAQIVAVSFTKWIQSNTLMSLAKLFVRHFLTVHSKIGGFNPTSIPTSMEHHGTSCDFWWFCSIYVSKHYFLNVSLPIILNIIPIWWSYFWLTIMAPKQIHHSSPVMTSNSFGAGAGLGELALASFSELKDVISSWANGSQVFIFGIPKGIIQDWWNQKCGWGMFKFIDHHDLKWFNNREHIPHIDGRPWQAE